MWAYFNYTVISRLTLPRLDERYSKKENERKMIKKKSKRRYF